MRSGYLSKVAASAARTTSQAKAPRTVVPLPVERVSPLLPGLVAEMPAGRDGGVLDGGVADAGVLASPRHDVATHAVERALPDAGAETLKREASPVPLRTAVRKMTAPERPQGTGEAVREAPRGMNRPGLSASQSVSQSVSQSRAQAAAQAQAMAGVLQRLSRPATKIEAPAGLREIRVVRAGEQGSVVAQKTPVEAGHARIEEHEVHRVDPDAGIQGARTGAPDAKGPASAPSRSESAVQTATARGRADVERLVLHPAERRTGAQPQGKDQPGAAFETTAFLRGEVREQSFARTVPAVPRTEHSTPRPAALELAHAPAVPAPSAKSERRVRIGQIDVQVNNQPAARRAPERSAGNAQRLSGLHPAQDSSRFLLRF